MYETQKEEQILQRLLSNAPSGINMAEGDFFYDAVSPAAIEFAMAYQKLEQLLEACFAETSYGEYLDKIAAELGLCRKAATKGQGLIDVKMEVGAKITVGDVLATWEGNIRFVAKETVAIGETGEAQIAFENETAGNLGNVLANTLFIAPVAIPGFLSANNPAQINAGTSEESDDSLKNRYFSVVRTPETSGNKHNYLKWAKEYPGIGEVRVFPPVDGNKVVKVVIIDSNKQPASPTLVSGVQEYIDPGSSGLGNGKAPIGAICTVKAADALDINVTATVGAGASTAQTGFSNDLTEYLKSIAFIGNTVSYAQIGAVLLKSIQKAGGTDYTGLLVNGGTSNIQLGGEQVAVTGTVTLT